MTKTPHSQPATLPKQLRTALGDGRCVLFIGAGASMDAVDGQGQPLPHWGQLLAELLNGLQDSHEPDPVEIVAEIEGMLRHGDLMSVAEWIDHRVGHHEFIQYMTRRLATAQASPVHDILSSKPFRAIMTTNYDRLAEIHWAQRGKNPFVVIPKDTASIATALQMMSTPSQLTPLIRAHGSLNDPNSLIFFPRSYREVMFRNEPFRQFMSTVFRQFTVLFVGTSFRDPNFQSLLQWVYTITDGKEAPHYAILDGKGPVFKNYMRKNYNIEFITYDAPGNDHSALRTLLKAL